MKFIYLASPVTLPGSPIRRTDAFEHDHMMQALQASAPKGVSWQDVSWDDAEFDWAGAHAAIIGTTWDYWDRKTEFLEQLSNISRKTKLYNSIETVKWNIHKSYLKTLQARGASIIPTVWLDKATPDRLEEAFNTLNCQEIVAKRQVGAGADGQYRLQRGQTLPPLPHPMMVQPFLPAIIEEGEFSFIFIDGVFSHALIKQAAIGDYRIQSTYGGYNTAITPSGDDLRQAEAILKLLEATPLYARVDMIRGTDGALVLMELELIEPFLYPEEGPDIANRLTQALIRRLQA